MKENGLAPIVVARMVDGPMLFVERLAAGVVLAVVVVVLGMIFFFKPF